MKNTLSIHWFRQDLRLQDNPALSQAAEHGQVLPVYILEQQTDARYAMGAASRWWLHHSLQSLNNSLNGQLHIYYGDPEKIIPILCRQYNVQSVFWNRCYEPWRIQRDAVIKNTLKQNGVKAQSFNGSLLWEPWQVLKADSSSYRVFTPFFRKASAQQPVGPPLSLSSLSLIDPPDDALSIADLQLLPEVRWDNSLADNWRIGEDAAQSVLQDFLQNGIKDYKQGRNFPIKKNVSRLSPYLHWGEISPRQIWQRIQSIELDDNVQTFKSELGWREFSYSLLYHFPELPEKNLQQKFDAFPWRDDPHYLKCWQQGLTGYPIVDAGMRELWQTGYMHNRVRMIVGSFLVKNLLLHWHHGREWFWDCLVDADLASNSASWQWIAGCGADAAPYFRIFNPVTQGEKFDASGEYTRRFIPELSRLPDKYLFKPWMASEDVLAEAGIRLGDDYPLPVVDLKASRERALEAFKSLRP